MSLKMIRKKSRKKKIKWKIEVETQTKLKANQHSGHIPIEKKKISDQEQQNLEINGPCQKASVKLDKY